MRARRETAALVTEAAPSRDEEFAARKRRYLLMMLARVVLLVVACVLVRWSLWAAIGLAAVGTVMPWLAVMLANDGPPKNSKKMVKARLAAADRTLEAGPSAPARSRVIDAAPVPDPSGSARPRTADASP